MTRMPVRQTDVLSRYESLRNPETEEERYTFSTAKPDVFVVVKFFDPIQVENATFKVFWGSYERVRSHWRTLERFDAPPDRWEAAELVIRTLTTAIAGEEPRIAGQPSFADIFGRKKG